MTCYLIITRVICSSEYSMENIEGRSGEGFRVNSSWTRVSRSYQNRCNEHKTGAKNNLLRIQNFKKLSDCERKLWKRTEKILILLDVS